MNRPLGLYIHIPFCRQRCDFCSFYLEVYRPVYATQFVEALKAEIGLYAAQTDITQRTFQSVYFGGGTPTVLGAASLIRILSEARKAFLLEVACEVSVEAHPSTVSKEDLYRLADAGVTRISFGAESMQDHELVRIGRPGLTSETVAAVAHARLAGFVDINLDLMYGLPGQSVHSWQYTLGRCLELEPSHLSCYALTIEADTKLARDITNLRCQAPDEALQVSMDEAAQEMLTRAGYERYEISNYARSGYACRHNLLYWTGGEYLGLGPSAQSFVSGDRFGNVADLCAYQIALDQRRLPINDCTTLTAEERLRDGVVFGLRLLRGIPADHLHRHGDNYGCTATIEELRKLEFIEEEETRARLTAKGRLYADHVAERLY